MKRRGLLIVTGLLVLAGVGSGCGSTFGVVEGGPLGPSDMDTAICIPAKIGQPVTIGTIALANTSDRDVVIDEVSFLDNDGLVIIQSLAIPNPGYPDKEGSLGSGATLGFPPDTTGFTEDWSKKMPTTGLTVPAHGPSVTWDLVFGLRGTKQVSAGQGIEIAYHDAQTKFHIMFKLAIEIQNDPDGCVKADDARNGVTTEPSEA